MKRMVIIDADRALRPLLRELLGSEGYETIFCQDSVTAPRCARDADPDAILLDLNLESRGAGWTVLAALKEDAALRDIPVIVFSADGLAIEEHAGYLESQGCAVLSKPMTLDALLTILDQLSGCPERQHRRLPVTPLPAPARRAPLVRWSGAA